LKNIFKDNKMKCNTCKRELPRKDMLTKNGCIWCDGEYHSKKKEKK